jgi:hypothetical protein
MIGWVDAADLEVKGRLEYFLGSYMTYLPVDCGSQLYGRYL